MKILLYNIAYGTGSPGSEIRRVLTGHHYLLAPERPFRKISRFIAAHSPDVVCLVETDLGSRRAGNISQVRTLTETLGYHSLDQLKYAPGSLLGKLPYWRFQGNAILSRDSAAVNHIGFFPCGSKKLILQTQIAGINFFLVHLALTAKVRRRQLDFLSGIIPQNAPAVVAGDFNTFGGAAELEAFLSHTRLHSANATNSPTYPAWKPHTELDYLLLSPGLEVSDFQIPAVHFSDHLPLLLNIENRHSIGVSSAQQPENSCL